MLESESKPAIDKAPVSILFNPDTISKKNIWEIDIIQILEILLKILQQENKKDLRVAGMAALSSSLIYRMKVESIFSLQKNAMEKKPILQRRDPGIEVIDLPFRHESTYPVTLNELLDLLENLIGSIANPRSRRSNQTKFEPVEVPNFKEYFNSLENFIERYEDLIINKIKNSGQGFFNSIIQDLNTTDSVRCFFAILFLAKDQKITLEQIDNDIKLTLVQDNLTT